MASRSPAPSPADTPFIEYLHSRAGNQLVAVIRYTDETATVEYTQDTYDDYVATHQESIVSLHQARDGLSPPPESLDAGDKHATVRLYDHLVTIDYPYPQPDAAGIIAIFRPKVAKQLWTFVEESETYLTSSV